MGIDRSDNPFDGLYAVTVTPFKEDLSVDFDRLEEHTGFLVEAGIGTITVNGNTGEFFSLTVNEAQEVLKCVHSAAGGRAVVVAGIGYDVETASHLGEGAAKLGCQAVMIHSPNGPYLTSDGYDRYVQQIADRIPLDIVLYVRSSAVTTETLLALAALPQTVGVKYAVNDPARLAELTSQSDGVVWCCGTAELWAPTFFTAGATSFTSGLANVAPNLSLELLQSLRSADTERVRVLWEALRPFEQMRSELDSGLNVSVVKEALHQRGQSNRFVRAPNGSLGSSHRTRIAEILSNWERLGLF